MSAFEFIVSLLKTWQDGKGGLRFEGVAASTCLDRQCERLTPDAMKEMAARACMALLPKHDAGPLEKLGTVEKCWVDNDQFRIVGSLDPTSSEAVRLYEKLKEGKQYGLSVGGRVLSAYREFDAFAGKHVKYIDDVALDHIAVCRPSSAANPDTYLSVLGDAATTAADAAEEETDFEQPMTMRPAPQDDAGNTVCDLECGQSQCGRNKRSDDLMHPSRMTTERLAAPWWSLVETPQLAAGSAFAENCEHCPECGRALGFDADGKPVVGYSSKRIEQVARKLANGWFSAMLDADTLGEIEDPEELIQEMMRDE